MHTEIITSSVTISEHRSVHISVYISVHKSDDACMLEDSYSLTTFMCISVCIVDDTLACISVMMVMSSSECEWVITSASRMCDVRRGGGGPVGVWLPRDRIIPQIKSSQAFNLALPSHYFLYLDPQILEFIIPI